MICPNCHEENPGGAEYCLSCGQKLETSSFKNEWRDIVDTARAESRYSGMKSIAAVFHVLGWIVNFAVLYIAYRVYAPMGIEGSIVVLLLGAIPILLLHSSGDRLKVIVDTEENTRQSVEYLRQILDLLKRNTEG